MALAVADAVEEELIALIVAYQNRINATADIAARYSRATFLDLPSVQRDYLNDFIREVRPTLVGARSEAVELTAALAAELSGMSPVTARLLFKNIPYDAPFIHTWADLKNGMQWEQAVQGGAQKAEQLGVDTVHDGIRARLAKTGLRKVGVRRVINFGACEWCQLVSVQKYRTIESATFGHGRGKDLHNCKCVPMEIYGKRDPGRTLNSRRYEALKEQGVPKRIAEQQTRRRAGERAARRA